MVWIAENMMQKGEILQCIDTWDGGEEHSNGEMDGAEERFDYNRSLALTGRNITIDKYKGTSTQHLAHWLVENPKDHPTFAFIYIDGSHIAKDVLTDATMAWPLLVQGGIMVFDDYLWGDARDILHRPKPAIDAFVNIFSEEIEMIHMGYQLIIRKK
jgi:cephalosporin hydroxylase